MLSFVVTRFDRIRLARVPAASCVGICAAALLLCTGPAQATTYKWTDANGRVIGLNTAVSTDAEGLGFAIPISDAASLIAQASGAPQS